MSSNFDVFDMLDLDMGTFMQEGMYHF